MNNDELQDASELLYMAGIKHKIYMGMLIVDVSNEYVKRERCLDTFQQIEALVNHEPF